MGAKVLASTALCNKGKESIFTVDFTGEGKEFIIKRSLSGRD